MEECPSVYQGHGDNACKRCPNKSKRPLGALMTCLGPPTLHNGQDHSCKHSYDIRDDITHSTIRSTVQTQPRRTCDVNRKAERKRLWGRLTVGHPASYRVVCSLRSSQMVQWTRWRPHPRPPAFGFTRQSQILFVPPTAGLKWLQRFGSRHVSVLIFLVAISSKTMNPAREPRIGPPTTSTCDSNRSGKTLLASRPSER